VQLEDVLDQTGNKAWSLMSASVLLPPDSWVHLLLSNSRSQFSTAVVASWWRWFSHVVW